MPFKKSTTDFDVVAPPNYYEDCIGGFESLYIPTVYSDRLARMVIHQNNIVTQYC